MDRNSEASSESLNLERILQRTRALYKQGQFTCCVEECDRAIKLGCVNGGIYNTKAIALTQLEQYDNAMEAINMAMELVPSNANFSKNKGVIEGRMNKTSSLDSSSAHIEETAPDTQSQDQYAKSVSADQSDPNAPLYVLKGTDGILCLYSDRVVIERSSKLLTGNKKCKEIFISNISKVKIKRPGTTSGYIWFTLDDENKNEKAFLNAFTDENSVTFLMELETAKKIHAKINELKVATMELQQEFFPHDLTSN